MTLLQRMAARAPVPLFAAAGAGAGAAVDALFLSPGVQRANTPRHASVLLLAGAMRVEDRDALRRLHDQLPHPRATLRWGAGGIDGFERCTSIEAAVDPLPALRDLYRQLVLREIESEPHMLPDEPPVAWRGKGQHGQGGKGMMGGTPYGRPMAMTRDDLRDGLALDEYTVELGPFLPALPSGLVLEVALQGDVIQRARVNRLPYDDAPLAHGVGHGVVHSHASHALRQVARMLALLELPAQAMRCLRLATRSNAAESPTPGEIHDLRTSLHRCGAFLAIPHELGQIAAPVADALGGLGLTARDRFAGWLDVAEHALTEQTPGAGRVQADAVEGEIDLALTDLLVGLEWHEATLAIASFDASALRRLRADPAHAPSEAASPHAHRGHAERAAEDMQ